MPRKPLVMPEPPTGLTEAQAELWTALMQWFARLFSTYDLSVAHSLALRAVIDVAGRRDAVRDQIDSDGLMIGGSTGQQRAHPLLALEAQLRSELHEALDRWRTA